MKKSFFITAFLFTSFLSAQDEVKLNITDALALKTFTVSYEHYLNDQTSLGLSGLFNFEGESSDFRYNENFVITPYLRHYFSTESLWNFFGEVFLAYNSGDQESVVNGFPVSDNYSDAALGIAGGYKYTSPGGFTVDIHGGLGRNMLSKESPKIVPRVGVNIGYQF